MSKLTTVFPCMLFVNIQRNKLSHCFCEKDKKRGILGHEVLDTSITMNFYVTIAQ